MNNFSRAFAIAQIALLLGPPMAVGVYFTARRISAFAFSWTSKLVLAYIVVVVFLGPSVFVSAP